MIKEATIHRHEDSMLAIDALDEFRDFAHRSGISLEAIQPDTAVRLMADFYAQVRAEDSNIGGEDMVLFQWGVYNWGAGEFFEYDIERQLCFKVPGVIDGEQLDEDVMWQLRLILFYAPTAELSGLKAGHLWFDTPAAMDDLIRFASNCEATRIVRELPLAKVEILYGQV